VFDIINCNLTIPFFCMIFVQCIAPTSKSMLCCIPSYVDHVGNRNTYRMGSFYIVQDL
jgi:hypothetical protein